MPCLDKAVHDISWVFASLIAFIQLYRDILVVMPSYRVAFIDLLVQTRVSDASIRLPTSSDVPCRLSCRPTPFYAILRWLLDRELLIGRAYPVSHCSLSELSVGA